MKGTITSNQPKEVVLALEEAISEEGLSPNDLIKKALADYLFVRKFRPLRECLMAETEETFTDQGVFDLIS